MFFFKKKKVDIINFFPEDFVDIHSHLLPGIDDGAENMEDSIALIKTMRSYGIKNFVTTPHVLGEVYPNTSKSIKYQLTRVQQELLKHDVQDISISSAAEYMLDQQFSELLEEDDLLTLKDNFILVELSFFNAPFNLFDLLFQIQLKGYKPVLAHPERYNFYHNDFQSYYRLKSAGCLFQLNFLSLTEYYGKRVQQISKQLLKLGLYDFVGTDTHHKRHLDLLKSLSTKKIKEDLHHLMLNNSKFFL